MVDLWAENIGVSTLRPPVVILKEQASLLGQKTKNIIKADAGSSSSYKDHIRHDFYIVAPALDNYHYKLFSISHHSIKFYPVNFDLNRDMKDEIYGNDPDIQTDSEEEFVDFLEKILKSDETKRVVHSLLTQSSGDFVQVSQVAYEEPPSPKDEGIPF